MQKSDFHFEVRNSHTVLATSTIRSLTVPATANGVILQADGEDIRFTLDGTDPTTSLGFLLKNGSLPLRLDVAPGVVLKFLQNAASANLQYQFVLAKGS